MNAAQQNQNSNELRGKRPQINAMLKINSIPNKDPNFAKNGDPLVRHLHKIPVESGLTREVPTKNTKFSKTGAPTYKPYKDTRGNIILPTIIRIKRERT